MGHSGHVWEHGLLEVPLKYGHVVRFFEPLPVATVADLYFQFAELQMLSGTRAVQVEQHDKAAHRCERTGAQRP